MPITPANPKAQPQPMRLWAQPTVSETTGLHHVRLVGMNGETVAHTESYTRPAEATKRAKELAGATITFKPRSRK